MKLKARHLILSSLLTLAMVAGVISGGFLTVYADGVIPTDKKIIVQMNDGAFNYYSQVKDEGKLVIDLYKVADIKAREGTSSVELIYSDDSILSEEEFKLLKESSAKEKNAQEYNDLASNKLNELFSDGNVAALDKASYSGINLSEETLIKKPGMYLLVVRGDEANSTFVKKISQKQIDKANESTEESTKNLTKVNYVTTTEIGNYSFTCAPQLVTLPYRDNLNDSENSWEDLRVTLKMIAEPLSTSIKIKKSLKGFNENQQSATFVFKVDVYNPDDDTDLMRSEYYSLSFTKEGTDELQVDGLPIGSKIEVSEVYSGFGYKLVKQDNTIFTLTDGDIKEVYFENENEGNNGGAGGLVNHFSADDNLTWSYDTRVDENGEYVEFDNGFTQNGRQYRRNNQ